MEKRRRDRDRRVGAIGAVPVMSVDGAVPVMSRSLLSLSLSLSLSLLFSKAGSHLKWKWKRKWFSVVLALIFGQLEMLFSLTEFEVTTKHPIFWKIISGISLKSIQTQPKALWVTCQRHGKCCQWKWCHLSKTWKINIFLITVFIYFYWMGYSILFIYKN